MPTAWVLRVADDGSVMLVHSHGVIVGFESRYEALVWLRELLLEAAAREERIRARAFARMVPQGRVC